MPWQMTSLTELHEDLGNAVAQRRGVGAVVAHVGVRHPVQLVRRHAGRDELRGLLRGPRRDPPGHAHRLDRLRASAPPVRCTASARVCLRIQAGGCFRVRNGWETAPWYEQRLARHVSESNQRAIREHVPGERSRSWPCSRSTVGKPGEWYYCLEHQKVEEGPDCPGKDRFRTARLPHGGRARDADRPRAQPSSGRTTPSGTTPPPRAARKRTDGTPPPRSPWR